MLEGVLNYSEYDVGLWRRGWGLKAFFFSLSSLHTHDRGLGLRVGETLSLSLSSHGDDRRCWDSCPDLGFPDDITAPSRISRSRAAAVSVASLQCRSKITSCRTPAVMPGQWSRLHLSPRLSPAGNFDQLLLQKRRGCKQSEAHSVENQIGAPESPRHFPAMWLISYLITSQFSHL